MAGKLVTVTIVDEGAGNKPHTVAQLSPADDLPVDLFAIELIPLGASGPTIPLEFDLCEQSDAGVSSDGRSAIQQLPPTTGESVALGVRTNFTTEPQQSTAKASFTVHQQSGRTWPAPLMPLRMAGGSRWGLRNLSDQQVKCKFVFSLRE